jgi:DNA-binding IclR family transcriptional regulator
MSEKLAAPASSLVKALDVLLALEQSPEGRGVTDIARALGLPKSAVHRLLVKFQACGFVQQRAETSRYTLGPVWLGWDCAPPTSSRHAVWHVRLWRHWRKRWERPFF